MPGRASVTVVGGGMKLLNAAFTRMNLQRNNYAVPLVVGRHRGDPLPVPLRPCGRAIDEQAKRFYLCGSPIVAKDYGDLSQLQFPSRLQAQVPVDNFSLAAYQQREHKSELFERGDHAVDRIVVSPQSSGIGKQPCDRPHLNFRISHLFFVLPNEPLKSDPVEDAWEGIY